MKRTALLLMVATCTLPGIVGYWCGLREGRRAMMAALHPAQSVEEDRDLGSGASEKARPLLDPPPNAARARFDAMMNRAASRDVLSSRLIQISEELQSMDASQILGALRSRTTGPGSELIRQLMMIRLAEQDPQMALSFAAGLRPDEQRAAERSALTVWTQNDPRGAATYFREHLDDFGVLDAGQRAAAESIASQWAKADPQAALRWAQELPEEVRLDALLPVLGELALRQPDQIVDLINGSEPGYERGQLIERLVLERSAQAPRETAEWIAGLTDSEEQSQAAAQVAQSWAASDATSAARWIASLQPGASRDSAVNSLIDTPTFRENPKDSMPWAMSIQDEVLRDAALQRVRSRWEVLDPTGAAASGSR